MALQVLVCDGIISTAPALACSGSWVAVDQSQSLQAAIDRLIAALPPLLDKLVAALHELFDFDAELFSLVLTACLLSWVSGHVLGRMMKAWQKVM